MRSLRSRLLRTLTVMLVLLFLAEWGVLGVAIRSISEGQMLVHLEHDGEALLAALQLESGRPTRLDPRGVEMVYQRPDSGHYFVLRVGEAEAFRSTSLRDFPLELRSVADGRTDHYRTKGPAGQSLIVFGQSTLQQGQPVVVYVAEDVSDTNRQIAQLSLASLAVFLPLLAAGLVVQGLAVRRALRPLVQIRDELREVGAGHHARITGDVPQEIKPLVDELNRLLELLHERLHRSRTALGNLAHALKTPLAMLFRLGDDGTIAAAQRETLRSQAEAIQDKLERELRRARVAGPSSGAAGAFFNPAEELPAMLQALGAIYRDKAIDFRLDVPDRLLAFDREDMLELVGNLADNASKWADARVGISVGTQGGGLQLSVVDDGPGCDSGQLAQIAQRGVRLDETKEGHGLGLSIVHDIVGFYGGTVTMAPDRQWRGLRVDVALPAPAAGSHAG
jgi:signal transduction histidine kinase